MQPPAGEAAYLFEVFRGFKRQQKLTQFVGQVCLDTRESL